MEPAAARQVIADALADIAPEVDLDAVDATAPFAATADLDSMDLLSLAEAIATATGVDIDHADLGPDWTLDALVAELAGRAG